MTPTAIQSSNTFTAAATHTHASGLVVSLRATSTAYAAAVRYAAGIAMDLIRVYSIAAAITSGGVFSIVSSCSGHTFRTIATMDDSVRDTMSAPYVLDARLSLPSPRATPLEMMLVRPAGMNAARETV